MFEFAILCKYLGSIIALFGLKTAKVTYISKTLSSSTNAAIPIVPFFARRTSSFCGEIRLLNCSCNSKGIYFIDKSFQFINCEVTSLDERNGIPSSFEQYSGV